METNSSLNQPVRILALGRFEITVDGQTLHCDGARTCKPQELLAGLVAAGPKGLAQHRLCEALWTESEGDAAYRALITTVYRLRRALHHRDAVSFAGGRVALNTELCWVDAWSFELLADGSAGSTERQRSVHHYCGPLFGDLELPLIFETRDRLRRKFVRNVLQCASQLEHSGQSADAVALYEQSMDSDGSCEELHCALITALGKSGQSLAARSAYQRCRAALLRRFGTVPSAATERAWREACMPQSGPRATEPGRSAYSASYATPGL
jgi:LuxR family transcriptional regulator, maltose regulon positive regulatory protein